MGAKNLPNIVLFVSVLEINNIFNSTKRKMAAEFFLKKISFLTDLKGLVLTTKGVQNMTFSISTKIQNDS